MALGRKIKELREFRGLTQEGLSALTKGKVSQGAIAALETRDSTSSRFLPDLAVALAVSPDELFSEVLSPERRSAVSNAEPASMESRRVPLISYDQAGRWAEGSDPYSVGDADAWLFTDCNLSISAFALRIKGDSMLPAFHEGDVVIIDPNVTPLPGDFVVAKHGDRETLSENECTFKKYRPRGIDNHGKQVFELVPLNDDYASLRSDSEPIKIIGTMIEHRRYRKR